MNIVYLYNLCAFGGTSCRSFKAFPPQPYKNSCLKCSKWLYNNNKNVLLTLYMFVICLNILWINVESKVQFGKYLLFFWRMDNNHWRNLKMKTLILISWYSSFLSSRQSLKILLRDKKTSFYMYRVSHLSLMNLLGHFGHRTSTRITHRCFPVHWANLRRHRKVPQSPEKQSLPR